MKCQTIKVTQNWYKVKESGEVAGYQCQQCYDKTRRAPLFQNFREKLKQRLCSNCNKKTIITLTKLGYKHERWYSDNKGGFYCNKCRAMLLITPEMRRQRNERRIKFRNKQVTLSHNPRTGYCSWCTNNIHDGSCKKTQIHHREYHEDDFLKDTVELCASCHRKETIRLSRSDDP